MLSDLFATALRNLPVHVNLLRRIGVQQIKLSIGSSVHLKGWKGQKDSHVFGCRTEVTYTVWPHQFKSPLLVPSSVDNRRTELLLTWVARKPVWGESPHCDWEDFGWTWDPSTVPRQRAPVFAYNTQHNAMVCVCESTQLRGISLYLPTEDVGVSIKQADCVV